MSLLWTLSGCAKFNCRTLAGFLLHVCWAEKQEKEDDDEEMIHAIPIISISMFSDSNNQSIAPPTLESGINPFNADPVKALHFTGLTHHF